MTRRIQLEDLSKQAPVLTEDGARFYRENCMVCFASQQHDNGVALHVDVDDTLERISVAWQGVVTPKMLVSYRDQDKRVDFGACAVALLIMPVFTGYAAVEPSATGDGVDYYLTRPGDDDELIFNGAARLEVSGIQRENESNTVADRVSRKRRRLRRLRKSSPANPTKDPPTFICVVEFGLPQSRVVTE